MTMTADELQAELDGIGEPPEVSSLMDGSGIVESNVQPCEEVDCSDIQSQISTVQTWLDDAEAVLDDLQAYVDDDGLERVINEAQLGARNAEQTGQDPGESNAIESEAAGRRQAANDNWHELHGQKTTEADSKNALESTHTHCCEESEAWHNFWHAS